MTQTTAPEIQVSSPRPARRAVRLVLASLAAVVVLSGLNVTPAAAADGTYMPTTVRCFPGRVDVKLNITGAHANQWVAVRSHQWIWSNGQWIYAGAGGWDVIQVAGPGTVTIGNEQQIPMVRGAYHHMGFEVSFWQGSQWGQTYYSSANHFRPFAEQPTTWCQT